MTETWKARFKRRQTKLKKIAKLTLPQREFAARLASMTAEAGRLGLFATQHKIAAAVQKVGWEIADQVEKKAA